MRLRWLQSCLVVLGLLGILGLGSVGSVAADNDSAAVLPVRDKWALIVGISNFKDPDLNLKYPAKDAKDFANFLVKEANFAPDHVHIVTDGQATRERILDELGDKWLPRVAAPGDLVVIYLSTHGSPSDMDVGGVNYIVAHDTDKERLYSTGIAMQDLCNVVKSRVHSDRTLIIMDACHSGATTVGGGKGLSRPANVDAEIVAQGTGQMVICSSSPNQLSWESKTAQNSVFTNRLIEGFKIKGKDTTVADTFDFIKKKVEEDVLRERGQMQSPVLKSKWNGDDLRISVKPIDPRPGLPLEITAPEPIKTAIASKAVSPPPAAPSPKQEVAKPDFAKEAENALREHFIRMSKLATADAYRDFTSTIQQVTPFARYDANMRKQKYVPSVSKMPQEAFKHVVATANTASVLVNEKWITGENLLWRYNLVKKNGTWLIDGFRIITPKEWGVGARL